MRTLVLSMDIDALKRRRPNSVSKRCVLRPSNRWAGAGFLPHRERLNAWLSRGDHADMQWIADRAHERTVPSALLPTVKNAIVLWMSHRTDDYGPAAYPTGRVAAYAWGRDYHNVVRKAVRKFERIIRESHPELNRYISIDTGAVLSSALLQKSARVLVGSVVRRCLSIKSTEHLALWPSCLRILTCPHRLRPIQIAVVRAPIV